MTTVAALNKEINGYGYTVTATVPTAFVNLSPTSMPTTSSITSYPTLSPVVSNAYVGSLSVTNVIIISVVVVFFGCAAIVGIILYFCTLSKRKKLPSSPAEASDRGKSIDPNDKSIDPFDESMITYDSRFLFGVLPQDVIKYDGEPAGPNDIILFPSSQV
jgi:hypothetical protein